MSSYSPAELMHVLFWQEFLHDLAQLQNCFFLLWLVFSLALLPLLGNQFVSCGMDWSICHFDAFSHTKNFIHNFLRVPAPEEDVVGPSHGKGDKLLQLPISGPALRIGGLLGTSGGSAAGGGQVPGVAEQELPAVAPVFVGLAVATQRLHPGGYPRVLAQVLRHLLRHVGPEGRGGQERMLHREGGGERGRAALSLRPAPAAIQRTPLGRPKHQTTEPRAAEPPTSARRRLLPFYNLAAAERPSVLPA